MFSGTSRRPVAVERCKNMKTSHHIPPFELWLSPCLVGCRLSGLKTQNSIRAPPKGPNGGGGAEGEGGGHAQVLA